MRRSIALLTVGLLACDPTSAEGTGELVFTTWGEDYIEHEIPSDSPAEAGFVDGWTLHYDKFLVSYRDLVVADAAGNVGARLDRPRIVDNTKPGRKELARFSGLEAKAWEKVAYRIGPATKDALVVAGDSADVEAMAAKGYAVYLEGTATKPGADGKPVTKRFAWGFTTATRYVDCHAALDGKDTLGVVVTSGGTETVELTTHGDHPFYDRLQASPDPAIATSLRFDEKAAADADGDGVVTLDELDGALLDVTKYDPSGLEAPTLGAFVRALVRTVGHFRGEGECTIARGDP